MSLQGGLNVHVIGRVSVRVKECVIVKNTGQVNVMVTGRICVRVKERVSVNLFLPNRHDPGRGAGWTSQLHDYGDWLS